MSKLEYLNPADWSLHVIDGEDKAVPESWILVPENADCYVGYNSDVSGKWTVHHFGEIKNNMVNEIHKNHVSGFNNSVDELIHRKQMIWQRESKPELVEEKTSDVDSILAERQCQYGCFEDVAFVTENIISILKRCNYDDMPHPHKMAMYMMASKMARLVSGDCNHLDSWVDIGGYSKLIVNLIEGK